MLESARKKRQISSDRNARLTPNRITISRPITPFRRAASASPTPNSRKTPSFRTPGTGRIPRGDLATRPVPSRRAAPTTPHAIRALRERASAARTPGHNRRRSGRIQRETPRDILRDLSRALARDNRSVEPAPKTSQLRTRHSALDLSDVEDGPDPTAPRLSMALDDMYDDDSFQDLPPRQSLLPDLPDDVDGGTIQSLEYGRRAISEDPRLGFPGRYSERFTDMSELGPVEEEYEIDGTFLNRRGGSLLNPLIDGASSDESTTSDLRGRRIHRVGNLLNADLGAFTEDAENIEEPTFRFLIPDRIRNAEQQGSQFLDDGEALAKEEAVGLDEEAPQSPDEIRVQNQASLAQNGLEINETSGWESDQSLDNDADLTAYREEDSALDRSLQAQSQDLETAKSRKSKVPKEVRISRRGLGFPSFPVAPIKRLASGFMRSQGSKVQLGKETIAVLTRTTDDFFEQIGNDLASYAQHAGRKMIEESDVVALMRRTRKTSSNQTPFSLAQRMLPRELLQQLRMAPPSKQKGLKRKL